MPDNVTLTPTDPYYALNQWHLHGTWGLNLESAWDYYTGAGVKVAVFDDGFDYNHIDLTDAYRTDLDYDTLGNDTDAAGVYSTDNHGTAVAGVISAAQNGIGMVGVAYDADLIGIRRGFGAQTSYQDTIEGFQYMRTQNIDVMNNSWSSTSFFADDFGSNYVGVGAYEVGQEIINVVSQGRNGLGASIVFSGGNNRSAGDNVNHHNYQNSPYTIAVGGIVSNGTEYTSGTEGAALLVSAGASGVGTLDATGSEGYVSSSYVSIGGTSFSAPAISGVIALMYEANEDLGYRDVQEILAMSTRRNDHMDSGWEFNGATHWNGGAMQFNHQYGFGVVDAYTAVRLAEQWTEQKTYANLERVNSGAITPNATISDNITITSTVTIAEDISIEHVLINLTMRHDLTGEVIVTLISPDGTQSILLDNPGNGTEFEYWVDFQMSSVAHWGESSAGTWTLQIEDTAGGGNTGLLQDWSLEFLGSESEGINNTYYYTEEYVNMTHGRFAFHKTLEDDNGGIDTINAYAVRSDMNVDMTPWRAGDIGGNLWRISPGDWIENLTAGSGNDTITGNVLDNILRGNEGDDTINGGEGNDTIYGGEGTDTINGGDGTDTLSFASVVSTNKWGVVIDINLEDQIVDDGYGNEESFSNIEIIHGSDYNDLFYGYAGEETLYGGTNNDTFFGSAGNDRLYGEAGQNDTINYSRIDNGTGVNVDLVKDRAFNDGFNSADRLFGIENVIGSNYDDTLRANNTSKSVVNGLNGDDVIVGNEFHNRLLGGDGNDLIFGGAGRDNIWGGDGHDNIRGDDGADRFFGGQGRDIIALGLNDSDMDTVIYTNEDLSDGAVDMIKHFELGTDRIDISNIIDFDSENDTLADFINIIDAGQHSFIEVDQNGTRDFTRITELRRVDGNITLYDLIDNNALIV